VAQRDSSEQYPPSVVVFVVVFVVVEGERHVAPAGRLGDRRLVEGRRVGVQGHDAFARLQPVGDAQAADARCRQLQDLLVVLVLHGVGVRRRVVAHDRREDPGPVFVRRRDLGGDLLVLARDLLVDVLDMR